MADHHVKATTKANAVDHTRSVTAPTAVVDIIDDADQAWLDTAMLEE